MAGLLTLPFFDVGAGITPADGALLYFNVVGSEADKDTYTTSAATTPHTNPVVANIKGVFPAIYIVGDYDWVLTDKNLVQINTGSVSELVTGSGQLVNVLARDTLNDAVIDTSLQAGLSTNIAERTTGSGGGAMWDVVLSSTVTENTFNIVQCTGVATLSLVYRIENSTINVKAIGVVGDDTADDYAAIAAAYNSGAAIVYFPQTLSSRYKIDTGLTPPNGVILVGSGESECRIRYTGTGTALTIGTSTTVLNKSCGVKGIKIELQDKTSKAIHLVGTEKAAIEDVLIEGLYQPFDNTRSNIGLHIDGANVSSFFNYMKNVRCTHIHESYRIESTGTLQATTQYFINCTALGDQDTDNTSIGYSFGSGGVSQEGQGTVISGGNVEKCNTCFLVGANSGRVTADGVRTEITKGGGTAWIFDFVDGCDPWTLTGIQGLGSSYMESNNGIRNFDSSNHVILSDEQGSIRLAGFDGALNSTKFLGIGGANPEIRHDANSELYIYSMGDATDTGRTLIQQGFGSASHGGHIDLSGATHATRPGDCTLGPSSTTGIFRVNKGLNGAAHFTVSPQTSRINMVIPTSAAGLSAGDIWNNSGVVTIV
jgi:hypothetical protein